MTWRALDTNEAMQDLMDRFGWFHDACLRDASLVTRTRAQGREPRLHPDDGGLRALPGGIPDRSLLRRIALDRGAQFSAHRHVDPDTEPPAVDIVAASMSWRPVADALGPVVRHRRLGD